MQNLFNVMQHGLINMSPSWKTLRVEGDNAVPLYKTTWGSNSFKDQVLDIEAWVYKGQEMLEQFLLQRSFVIWTCFKHLSRNGSICNWFRDCWVHDIPCCLLWSDCIASNLWHCWSNWITWPVLQKCDRLCMDITKLTVGYLEDADMEVVHVLRSKGVKVVPFELNYTVDSVQVLNYTMDVNLLAHFDECQRTGTGDDYEAQDQWPLEVRVARVVTAVDYIQDAC
ncbi:hypothetical protein POM88_013440 [Heracleum sosnowskyi]|uniref:Uncharacterized protein n=1 Tax=Heracleum sosnowskyi TaxID=360622 RepID=A0AAD8N2Q1_9APIA|nr:hypothetical protein POM88_013440 [Heracleum sosnowskyi]